MNGKYTYYTSPKGNIQLVIYRRNRNILSTYKLTEEDKYFIKQKLCGIALIGISILSAILLADIIASVFLLPLGIAVLTAKEKVCTF